MMVQALQSYVNLVNSLSKASRDRTRASAHDLLSQAGLEGAANDAGERFSKLVEELVNASRANRELVESLVSAEVTRVVRGLGFVRSDDLDELREEIAELRHQLDRHRRASDGADTPRTPAGEPPGRAAPSPTGDSATAAGESAPGTTPNTGSAPAKRAKSSRRTATAATDPAGGTPPPGVSPDAAVSGTGLASARAQAPSKRRTAGQAAAAGRSSRSSGPRGTAPGAAPSVTDDADLAAPDPGAPAADGQQSAVGGADAGA